MNTKKCISCKPTNKKVASTTKKRADWKQKRGMTTKMRKSMSVIPKFSSYGENSGPEMIQASDQIKRVVDESCEIVKELEKLRLKLNTKRKDSEKLKYKLGGRRNGLKLMREKVAMHALMGYVLIPSISSSFFFI